MRDVPGHLPEDREDERVDAHHRERVDQRPEEAERGALEARAQLAADQRAQAARRSAEASRSSAARSLEAVLTAMRPGYLLTPCASSSTSARSRARAPGSATTSAGWSPGWPRRPAASTSWWRSGRRGRAGEGGSARRSPGWTSRCAPPLAPHALRQAWSRSGRLPVERLVGRLDVFHFSDWMYPPQRAGLRATTVHDLVPLRFPDWVEPETLRMHGPKYEHAAQTCDRIFVNSRFTGGEVVELLGVPEERVVVAYPGIDPIFRPDGRGGRPRRAVRARRLDARAAQEPARARGRLRAAAPAPPGADARARRARGLGASGRSRPRACGCSASSPTTSSPASTAARRRSRTRRGSRASGSRSSRRSRAASRPSSPRIPSLDEASGEAALRVDPDDPEAFADALEQALAAPRGTGARARGPLHLAGLRRGRARGLPRLTGVPLRVGMDVSALALTRAGTARHIRSLLDALEDEDVDVRRYSLGGSSRALVPVRDLGWYLAALPAKARRDGVDVLHCPTQRAPVRSRVPLVVTFHDLAVLRHPGDVQPLDARPTRGACCRAWFAPATRRDRRLRVHQARAARAARRARGEAARDPERGRRALLRRRRGRRRRLRARGLHARAAQEPAAARRGLPAGRPERPAAARRGRGRLGRRAGRGRRRPLARRGAGRRAGAALPRRALRRLRLALRGLRPARARGDGVRRAGRRRRRTGRSRRSRAARPCWSTRSTRTRSRRGSTRRSSGATSCGRSASQRARAFDWGKVARETVAVYREAAA